jgi:hypothetical protein
VSEHVHSYERYGDHGPDDYGDPLATYCPGCGRLRDDIESAEADARAVARDDALEAEARALLLDELEAAVRELPTFQGSRVEYRASILALIQQHREAIR